MKVTGCCGKCQGKILATAQFQQAPTPGTSDKTSPSDVSLQQRLCPPEKPHSETCEFKPSLGNLMKKKEKKEKKKEKKQKKKEKRKKRKKKKR